MIGWVLDSYPTAAGMRVWIIDESGRAFSFLDPWFPSFYLKIDSVDTKPLYRVLHSFHAPFSIQSVQKKDFFTNEVLSVVQIKVKNPLLYGCVTDRVIKLSYALREQGHKLSIFNADLNLSQMYFYKRDLFPFAKVSFEADQQNIIRNWQLIDSCWDLEYELPPLRYARLSLEFTGDPNHGHGKNRRKRTRGNYVLTLGKERGKGTSYIMDDTEDEFIRSLNRHMRDWDPDVLLSDWGDSYLMPRVQFHAERTGIPLALSRDREKVIANSADHSFFSYGKMVYRAGPRTLFGRLHIDMKNSFTASNSGLDGLYEVARVAKIPVQRAARCTIGTSLSSMQHLWAIKNDYLIPIDKGQTEDFRPADEFVVSDRGGLVYEPDIGWHEHLIEFDFVSMYPEIMVRNNITPEAVNCACCSDNKVPEIKHHLCQHRKGMVPAVLGPIVKKRQEYKELIQNDHPHKDIFQSRREAFKWALVTCFGYLGFRNARFGRIEAHECVNAYSREALLKAKEVAEKEGFYFVHAIVDSLWLKKPGATAEEIESLRLKIEKETQLPLGFEGRYRWIRFCPSKMNSRVGVPNRYLGVFEDGTTKVRGIEIRRHDTPVFIKKLQDDLLQVMSQATSLSELQKLRPQVENVIQSYRDQLHSGHMAAFDLAISCQLSKDPSEYLHDTLSAIAAKKLAASGADLHPGEMIQYVVSEERDQIKDWRVTPLAFIDDYFEYDVKYYERLLERAIDITPFFPFSVAKDKVTKLKKPKRQLMLPGFDFEKEEARLISS